MSGLIDEQELPQLHCLRHNSESEQRIMLQRDHRWNEVKRIWRDGRHMQERKRVSFNMYWQGSGEVRINNSTIKFTHPACVMRHHAVSSDVRLNPGQIRESWIIISASLAKILEQALQINRTQPVMPIHDRALTRRRLHDLGLCMQRGQDPQAWPEIMARLQMLCASFWLGDAVDNAHRDMRVIRQAVKNNPKRNWNLKNIAELCQCNEAALRQRFHRRYQCGPVDIVTRQRMEMAGQLLATMLVKQVAHELGYKDYRSFSRQFKQHYGCSPSQYTALSGV